MLEKPPAAKILEELLLPFRIFRHTGTIESVSQVALERDQSIGQIVRSILFRLSEGNFILIMISGNDQVSWKKLRSFLGQSRLTLATKEEVFAITGYQVGSVSPLGSPGTLRILADEKVFQNSEISIGSGLRGTAIIMKSKDLLLALKMLEVVSLSENTV